MRLILSDWLSVGTLPWGGTGVQWQDEQSQVNK